MAHILPPRLNALLPHPNRFSSEDACFREAMEAHDAACENGLPGYTDPITGLFTMTAQYHLERGSCCNNGCRHCPYLPLDGDDLP